MFINPHSFLSTFTEAGGYRNGEIQLRIWLREINLMRQLRQYIVLCSLCSSTTKITWNEGLETGQTDIVATTRTFHLIWPYTSNILLQSWYHLLAFALNLLYCRCLIPYWNPLVKLECIDLFIPKHPPNWKKKTQNIVNLHWGMNLPLKADWLNDIITAFCSFYDSDL